MSRQRAALPRMMAYGRGCLAASILAANTLFFVLCMVPFGFAKAGLPVPGARRLADRMLNAFARAWVRVNGAWVRGASRTNWDVAGTESLDPTRWYLIICNHRSWADIFVLQDTLSGRIPLLKFFLKRELIYVPIIGLAWWALDFPFVSRKDGVRAKRDLVATRLSCRRFLAMPTTVLNFPEGTRYTADKAAAQNSPYRHLLKPKAGGTATALAVMREKVGGLLDVTIVYPYGTPTFWALLCGQADEVVVRVRRVALPGELAAGSRVGNPKFRLGVQEWLNDVWREKDLAIEELLRRADAESPGDLARASSRAMHKRRS